MAKADPYAFHAETRPNTSHRRSRDISGAGGDANWLEQRRTAATTKPLNIYRGVTLALAADGGQRISSHRDTAEYLRPRLCGRNGHTWILARHGTTGLDMSWG